MPLVRTFQLALLAAGASASALVAPTGPGEPETSDSATASTTKIADIDWDADPTEATWHYLKALEGRVRWLEATRQEDLVLLVDHEERITAQEAAQVATRIALRDIESSIAVARVDITVAEEALALLEPRVSAAEVSILGLRARRVTADVFRTNADTIVLPDLGSAVDLTGEEHTVHSWEVPEGETLDVAARFGIKNDSIDGVGARAQLWAAAPGRDPVVLAHSTIQSSTVMGRTAELSMLHRVRVDKPTTFTLTLASITDGDQVEPQTIAALEQQFGYRTYIQFGGQIIPVWPPGDDPIDWYEGEDIEYYKGRLCEGSVFKKDWVDPAGHDKSGPIVMADNVAMQQESDETTVNVNNDYIGETSIKVSEHMQVSFKDADGNYGKPFVYTGFCQYVGFVNPKQSIAGYRE